VRIAEPRQVESDDAIPGRRERADRREERRLRPAQAVNADDCVAFAGGRERQLVMVRVQAAEPQAPALARAGGGRQEAHAQMKVAAHAKPARLEGLHTAADVVGDPPPGPAVGTEGRFGVSVFAAAQLGLRRRDNRVPGRIVG